MTQVLTNENVRVCEEVSVCVHAGEHRETAAQ